MSYLPTFEEIEALSRQPNRVIENPGIKDRITVLKSHDDTKGNNVLVRLEFSPDRK